MTVQRIRSVFAIAAHCPCHFKLSTDQCFAEEVRYAAGLYLNPPGNLLVLYVNEESQVRALDRT